MKRYIFIKIILLSFVYGLLFFTILQSTEAKIIGTKDDKVIVGLYNNIIQNQSIIAVSANSPYRLDVNDKTKNKLYSSDLKNFLSENYIEMNYIKDSTGKQKDDFDNLKTGDILVDNSNNEKTIVLYGDINKDGNICEVDDINLIIKDFVYNEKLTGIAKIAANVYVDNLIDISDINRLKNKYLGFDTGISNYLGDTLVSKMESENQEDDENIIELKIKTSNSSIEVSETTNVTATITPSSANHEVTFSSSNTSIATVNSNGIVTGISEGTAIITAQSTKYADLKATIEITVSKNIIHIEELAIEISNSLLNVGDFRQVVATITPSNATNKTIEWTSNNTNVATVNSNGIVEGISDGTATITATVIDGSTKISAEITITVTSEIKIEEISMISATTVYVGSSTSAYVQIYPSNATNKTIEWTSSNISVATVDSNGKITGIKEGTATITAKTTDGSNLIVNQTINVIEY